MLKDAISLRLPCRRMRNRKISIRRRAKVSLIGPSPSRAARAGTWLLGSVGKRCREALGIGLALVRRGPGGSVGTPCLGSGTLRGSLGLFGVPWDTSGGFFEDLCGALGSHLGGLCGALGDFRGGLDAQTAFLSPDSNSGAPF